MQRRWAGLALAVTLGALPASADPPRDSLHEGNAEVWQVPDPRGMSLLLESRRRTPSGFLYPYPPAPYELSDLGGGWRARGALESGYFFTGGDETETRYTRYSDRSDGFFVNGLNLELWRPETGDWAMLRAGSLGRDDQFYDLEASRAGWLRFRGSFSGVPHKYASDAVSLWAGGGTDVLTLPAPLSPAGNTPAALQAALDSRSRGTVAVERERTKLELRVRALPALALVASYGLDARNGAIPTAAGFAYPDFGSSIGGALEVPAPVDDQTHSARAALEWASDLAQFSLAYNASLYRNSDSALTLAQPFESFGIAPITQARLALPPDNDWHNVRADLGVNMPLRSRLTTAISWSRATQDDDLLAPTISGVTIGATDLLNWNGAGALSTKSAHARVDQLLIDLDVHLNPWRPLRLRGGYRFTNQETETDYVALNPTTGEFGYIVEDGGHAAILGETYLGVYQPAAGGSKWRYRSTPWGESHETIDLGATLTAPWRTSLDLLLEQEDVEREVSERPETRERRATVSLNSRALSFATARLSYKYIGRDGGEVDYDVFRRFTTASFPTYVEAPGGDYAHGLNQLVRPALADLEGQRIQGRFVFALGDFSDVSLVARLRSDDYGSDYGLTSDRTRGLEADWTVQASPALSANVFVSFDQHDRRMQNIRGFATFVDNDNGDAGGPNYSLTNQWGVRARGDATAWGGGLRLAPLRWLELDTRYTFLVTREKENQSFASTGAIPVIDFASAIPDALPTLRSRDHMLETSLRVSLRESLALRVYYRYERSSVDDFHQTGLPTLIGRRIYLGHEDSDYEASFYGVALQVSFGSGW